MMNEITEQPLTLNNLHVGAQVVIAPADNGRYEGAIVTALTDRIITTTAGKFNRRNGVEWGAGGLYHYRDIAHSKFNGYALMTWAEARERNANADAAAKMYRAQLDVRDRVAKKWRDLTYDQAQRIAAILDEAQEHA